MLLNFPFNILSSKDASGNVDVTIPCLTGGTVTVVGQQNTQQQGNLSMTFADCSNGANSLGLHGVAAVTINAMTDATNNFEIYYDNLIYVRDGIPIVISGYIACLFEECPVANRYMSTRDTIATERSGTKQYFYKQQL